MQRNGTPFKPQSATTGDNEPMKPLVIDRRPWFYSAGLVEVLVLVFVLSFPAATCRGVPPLAGFWILAPYLGVCFIRILPIFDDYGYSDQRNRKLLAAFSSAAAFLLSLAMMNLMDARPHFGYQVGYMGLLRHRGIDHAILSLLLLPLTFPFVICWERAWRNVWDHIRRFRTPLPGAMRVIDMLCLVASVTILFVAIRFIVRLYPSEFHGAYLERF